MYHKTSIKIILSLLSFGPLTSRNARLPDDFHSLNSKLSRPSVVSTPFPIKWVPEALSTWVNSRRVKKITLFSQRSLPPRPVYASKAFLKYRVCFYLLKLWEQFKISSQMSSQKLIQFDLNILNPNGHVMHQQFNIQQLYVLPTLYLCVYLGTNSDLCHLQHKLIGFYNRDEKCLLRGTNWLFK